MINTPSSQTINPLDLSTSDSLQVARRDRRNPKALILAFDEVSIADIPLVGGKNASLGEMIQQLTPKGVKVPSGFATTALAYRYFIQAAGIAAQLHQIFAEFARFLVEQGIDSISLNPDSILKTRLEIARAES